jgi:hypothetical protein
MYPAAEPNNTTMEIKTQKYQYIYIYIYIYTFNQFNSPYG